MKRTTLALAILTLVAERVTAQSLTDRMTDLFRFGSCGEVLCLTTGSGHGNHFIPSSVSGNATLLSLLTNSIAANASNIPISATTSGVTYTFSHGLPIATTSSSGPIFAERGNTLGKGRLMIGANVNILKFSQLRGVNLDSVAFTFTHEDEPPAGLGDPNFENDLIKVNLNLNLTMTLASFVMTYGVSDRVDLGIAIPVVHTSLSGRSKAQIVTSLSPPVHFFGGTSSNPILSAITSTNGSSTGVGDIALRLKARVAGDPDKSTLGFLGDVRLGTGSVDDFQGSGGTTIRALGIASTRFGDFSPHVNAGVAIRSGTYQNNALLATGGFDHALTPRATFAFDVISEWQMGENKILTPDPVQVGSNTVQLTNIPNKKGNIVAASVGAKVSNPKGLSALINLLVPLMNGALKPNAMLTIGAEYSY